MIIRVAKPSDMPEIETLYRDWTADNIKGIDFTLAKERIRPQIEDMISKNSVILAEHEGKTIGGIGGIIIPSSFTEDTMFVGMFLYFHPKHRGALPIFIRLLHVLLAKSRIDKLVLAAPPGNLEKLYPLLGFKKLETHYYIEVEKEVHHAG